MLAIVRVYHRGRKGARFDGGGGRAMSIDLLVALVLVGVAGAAVVIGGWSDEEVTYEFRRVAHLSIRRCRISGF